MGCGDDAKPSADATPTTTTAQQAQKTAPTTSAASPAASATASDDRATILAGGSVPIQEGATAVYGVPPGVDFGVVQPGSKLRTSITLVNPTRMPIRILKATPTCQCTTVTIDGLTIPATGGVRVPLTLQVPNTTGIKQAAVNMVLMPEGEGQKPIQGPRLTLQAVAAYPVRTSPLYIDALTPAGMTGNVNLNAVDGVPFKVLSVNGKAPSMATPNAPATAQVVSYDLRGETAATMPKWLFIETDHPEAPMVELRIRHEWSKLPHQVRPMTIIFDGYLANVGAISPNVPVPFTIELKQFKNRQVLAVDSADPSFQVAMLRQIAGDGDRVRVDASVTAAPNASGPFEVPITVRTREGSETMYLIGTVR